MTANIDIVAALLCLAGALLSGFMVGFTMGVKLTYSNEGQHHRRIMRAWHARIDNGMSEAEQFAQLYEAYGAK